MRVYLALTLWLLGYPEQALEQEAVHLSREVSHANSQAFALGWTGIHYRSQRVRELAEATNALCRTGLKVLGGLGNQGWSISDQLQGDAIQKGP